VQAFALDREADARIVFLSKGTNQPLPRSPRALSVRGGFRETHVGGGVTVTYPRRHRGAHPGAHGRAHSSCGAMLPDVQ
jgi:hypothetical protein